MVQVDWQDKCTASARRRAAAWIVISVAMSAGLLAATPLAADPLIVPAPSDQAPHRDNAQRQNGLRRNDKSVVSADAVAAGRYLAAQPTASASAASSNTLAPELDSVAFGAVVAELDNFRLVPAWQRVLQRAVAEDALCRASCGSKAWQRLIVALRQLPAEAQIGAVQQRLNRVPYRDDMANWHVVDYWATPDEFLRKGGDCEDYAIAKYFALRAAGWPAVDLRIMLSHRRGEAVGHAYLILRDRGDWLVLDNRQVQPYRPAAAIDELWAGYSLNEENLWIHRNPAAPNFIVSSRQ
ncbi:MAG TPA: transglutaminase-like cysteine peptidase [Terriglobales bacterium]|nr:transglutaminase-like cysteine peptidase [Terriglobales bacterium]